MPCKLVMRFKTETGDALHTISVDQIKTDDKDEAVITKAEVVSLMDTIIAKNVFATKNGKLIGKKDARIVKTDTTEMEF